MERNRSILPCRLCQGPTGRSRQARYCLDCLKVSNRSNYNKAVGQVRPRGTYRGKDLPAEEIERIIENHRRRR